MIEPRYGVLQNLFADRVFRIPHYQRFYSWRQKQRNDLFSDLRKLAGSDEDKHHFMATIVCHRTAETKNVGASQYRVYDIVDGQQRLTTLIILLKCIEMALPEKSEDRGELAKILVKRDGHLILLQTNNANEYIFNRFLREGLRPENEHVQTHSDRNLAAAIGDCDEFVREWCKSRDILSLMSLLLHRLGFVVYDTEDSRVVYTVFEVLNSRGLAVDLLDKTKSMLMGRAFELSESANAADAEINVLKGMWSHIYTEIARENVSGDEIVRVTATLYYGPGGGKPLSADDSLQALRDECDAADKPQKVSLRLLDVAKKLVSVHGNVFLGPVTDILHARVLAVAIMSTRHVSEQERDRLLKQWERVTFRIFGLCSKDARTKVGDYVRLAAQIVASGSEISSAGAMMAELRALGADYSIDEAVKEGLVGQNCYDTSPEMCRYILWLYEEHLAEKLGKGATIDEHDRNAIWKRRATDSIEHIFPQNPWAEDWWTGRMNRGEGTDEPVADHVGRIGNLLLLPIVINQEAKISPFPKKKKLYEKHNLRMIREVCDEAEWTLTEIEARERRIVKWAKIRWADLV